MVHAPWILAATTSTTIVNLFFTDILIFNGLSGICKKSKAPYLATENIQQKSVLVSQKTVSE